MDGYLLMVASLNRDVDRTRSIALNVANAATPGFKRWINETEASNAASAEAPPVYGRDLSAGKPVATGRALDVFLPADLYLALDVPGQQLYSRGGRLDLDPEGRLVTEQGHPLRLEGVAGPLPAGVEIAPNGRLLHEGVEVGRLAMVRAETVTLLDEGVYSSASVDDVAAGSVLIEPGAYEGSNVQLTDEMVDMMRTLRHLDSVQRVLKHEDALNERLFSTLAKF